MCQDAIVCYQNAAQACPQNAIAYGEYIYLWLILTKKKQVNHRFPTVT
jgi:hypothetical protein